MKENLSAVLVEHYPFTIEESSFEVRSAICRQFKELLVDLSLPESYSLELRRSFAIYFIKAENLFYKEEQGRLEGQAGANLYYHRKEHAIYQATYDAIAVVRAILRRKDAMSSHLTLDGIIAAILGAMYHDSGYVDVDSTDNYAARTPIHVGVSMETVSKKIDSIGLPSFLNAEKIKTLAKIGIHSTSFPFNNDRRLEMRQMILNLDPNMQAEAHIVRLSTQLADLGGQVARVDYYPNLIKDLRQEINGATPGMGENIIGEDHQLAEKCRGFIAFMVEPTVGKIAKAFFRGKDNYYNQRFEELIKVA